MDVSSRISYAQHFTFPGITDRRDDATGELMLGSVRLNRLSTPNINQRLSSTLLGIACLMVYSSCLRHPLSTSISPSREPKETKVTREPKVYTSRMSFLLTVGFLKVGNQPTTATGNANARCGKCKPCTSFEPSVPPTEV